MGRGHLSSYRRTLRVAQVFAGAESLVILVLIVWGGGLRLYNLLALDPFVDELMWVNQAEEYVNDTAHYLAHEHMPDIPRINVAPKLAGVPGPLFGAAREFDQWQSRSTLWLPTAVDGRPPLFYWITLVMTKLPGNPIVLGRLQAVIADVASGCLLYVLARQVYTRGLALAVGLLWSVSPFGLLLSRIASDDPLLTLFSLLVIFTSFRTMRTSSRIWPVFLGLSLAGAMYTKTLGLVCLVTPLLALVILLPWTAWLRKAPALAVSYAVAIVAVAPLAPWIFYFYGKANEFADFASSASGGDTSGVVALLNLRLLTANLARADLWAMDYFKLPFLAAVIAGCCLALVRRDRLALLVLMTVVVPCIALLDRATLLFSRYFMYAVYPAYVLGAIGVVELGLYVGRLLRPERWFATLHLIGSGLAVGGLSVVIGAWTPLALGVLTSPADAPLPNEDHIQYVEHWYALTGLSKIADYIRAAAVLSDVTVVEPVRPWWYYPRLPEDALRYYLWDQPQVRFVESEALRDAVSLCDLRQWTGAAQPVFLVLNGAYDSISGAPPDIPRYTGRLEAALARDVPEAHEVLRIPRPNAINFLSVIRINPEPTSITASACA